MPSLTVNYDYLPFDLKKCFSYFGLFPEDYRFDHSEMNRLFVALGIIDSTQQVDTDYLEELVDNGFLMKGADDDCDEYYVLHDLMHELCRSVSGEECLSISGLDFRADDIPESVRHLSITTENRYDENFETEMCKLRDRIDIANLRTLMIFREYEGRFANLLKDVFKEINSLRVLYIVVTSPESFPHRFSKLIHLQYLKISSAKYQWQLSLPSTLSRFYHLKFLDLHNWRGSCDLPKDFSHLENLHDLIARSELHSNICNVGKIKHLQKLNEFHVKKESMGFELREVGALTKLEGELIIRRLDRVTTKAEATAAKLALKKNLKKLDLLWHISRPDIDASDILNALQPHSNLRVLTIKNPGGTIGPSWLCIDIELTSLENLTLDGVSWSTLPPLGKLPNLKVLILKRNFGILQFQCGGTQDKCFMRLKTVEFHEMPKLSEWVVETDCHSFPSLEVVECVNCPNLRVMPFSEVSCTSLCRLMVSGCPKMSLPSMPHTSTLTDLFFQTDITTFPEFTYDGENLVVNRYGGDLAFHNLDKVEDMVIRFVSHISVLEEMPHLGSLQRLSFAHCPGLVLVPVENGERIQEEDSLLQSLKIDDCDELLSRWPMGGGARTIYPFPASLRELDVFGTTCMKSMDLLSNLTSLTSLSLSWCIDLTVDGLNPLSTVNLKTPTVCSHNTFATDLISEVARTSRLEELSVNDISGLLVAPICSHLAPTLHTLEFGFDNRTEIFMEEQEKALQLLTSLQNLEFSNCDGLQSLPQGLHLLSSLKEFDVNFCPKIRALPKEGFPVSLRKLRVYPGSAEIDEKIEKIKRTNPDLTVTCY